MASSCSSDCQLPPLVKTVMFIRHGEAIHNIEERGAQKLAGEEAEALGHAKGSAAHKAMCEVARKAVLKNEAFRDAPLSEAGKIQAAACKEQLVKLFGSLGLTEPEEVLVSPLLRTLQTANEIFPQHRNVRVCEQLRERRTGAPCDECEAIHSRAQCFAHMDWVSPTNLDDTVAVFDGEPQRTDFAAVTLEDAVMLRRRTGQLADILQSCSTQTVCIIGHKGYFRELERGPFRRPAATEFGNCEVRVYDVALPGDGAMHAALRDCKDEQGPSTVSKEICGHASGVVLREANASSEPTEAMVATLETVYLHARVECLTRQIGQILDVAPAHGHTVPFVMRA